MSNENSSTDKSSTETYSKDVELTWAAHKVHHWHYFIDAILSVSIVDQKVKWLDPNIHKKSEGITKDQWLNRKAELGIN